MRLAAVVVTYNSAQTISRCVKSLWASGVTTVLVVDNASTDQTRGVLRGLGVTFVALPQNIGFAGACNLGASFVGSAPILFINPDAHLTAGALDRAVQTLHSGPKIGAVGFVLQDEAQQPEVNSFGREVTLGELLRRSQENRTVPTTPQDVGWTSAGALLVRAQAFRAVDGFDGNFFMYWEDVDLAKRLRASGWRIVLDPRARVVHLRGASLSDTGRKTQLYDQAADRYFRKHYATPIWLTQRLWRKTYRLFSSRVQ